MGSGLIIVPRKGNTKSHPLGWELYLRGKDLLRLQLLGPPCMRTLTDGAVPCHLAWVGLAAELTLSGAVETVPILGCFEFLEGRSSLASCSALLICPH